MKSIDLDMICPAGSHRSSGKKRPRRKPHRQERLAEEGQENDDSGVNQLALHLKAAAATKPKKRRLTKMQAT